MDRRPFAASFPNAGNSNGTGAPSPRPGGENWKGLRLLFLLSSGGISFHRSLSSEEMSEDRESKYNTAFRYCLPRESTLSRRIRGRERERVCTGTVPSIFALRGILRREGRWRRLLGKFLEITALELESHPILRSPPKLVPKKDRIVPGSFPRFRVHRGWTRA